MENRTHVTTATLPTPVIELVGTASLATSVEEIPPQGKRKRTEDKQKEKADFGPSNVQVDVGVALARVQDTFTVEDMKVFSGVSANEVVGRHLHKVIQVLYICDFTFSLFLSLCIVLNAGFTFQVLGESLHITSEYLTQEAKITSAMSRVEALEVENSKLKKDLIAAMDEANFVKEKVKSLGDDLRAERQLTLEKDEQLLVVREKLKTIAAKAVEAFQQTDKYNTVLFSWYFKGFELLR